MNGDARALSRTDILAAQDLVQTEIDVPEWGGKLYLRGLSAAERSAYENRFRTLRQEDPEQASLKAVVLLIAMTAISSDGRPVFTEEDLDALAAKSFDVLLKVFHAARRVNGMAAGDDEDAEKN